MPSNSEVRVVRTSGEEDVTTIPADAPDGRLLLCYWNMRCLAQPIRLALEYVCCDFVDVRLDCEEPDPDDSSVSKRNWFRQKAGLRLPFGGNLPFLLDGENGARVVQSNAILRYVGRKFGLIGDGSWQQTLAVDMLLNELSDLDGDFIDLTYYRWESHPESRQAFVQKNVPKCIRCLAEALGTSKPYLVGGTPTIVDFKALELLLKFEIAFGKDLLVKATDLVSALDPQEIAVVAEYLQRMKSLPTLRKYMESKKCITRPLNNPHAQYK